MSDFRVHPALTSPAVAGVAASLIGMTAVDLGVLDALRIAGDNTTISPETWSTILEIRWITMAVSFAMAWLTSYCLFSVRAEQIKFPPGGVALGIFGSIGSIALAFSMLHSLDLEEFRVAAPVIWRVGALWSSLALLGGLGCLRIGLMSYRMIRGQQ